MSASYTSTQTPLEPGKPTTTTKDNSGRIFSSADITDKSKLIDTLKEIEKDLGDQFMQALHKLDTAYNLPEAAIKLSKSLHSWREEVEHLFPSRGKSTAPRKSSVSEGGTLRNDQRNTNGSTPDRPKSDALAEPIGIRIDKKPRKHQGVRFVSKQEVLVDNNTWRSFLEASKVLSRNLLNFLSALHYLSEHRRTWCAVATGELMVTLEEMCVALHAVATSGGKDKSSSSQSAGKLGKDIWNPRNESDLKKFIAVRLAVFQTQLWDVLDAMGDYERNEINHIRLVQSRAFDGLRNVTTVSTFFAGVIASTLQFSLTADQTVPFIIINAFWLSSLVFSIGSALNSFLGMAMRKLASLTPLSKQPRIVKLWIGGSDLTLLVISIIAYAVGLAVYVINSQHSVVSIVTCVGAACCAIGIAIVWLHQLLDRFLHRRKRSSGTSGDPVPDEDNQDGEETDTDPTSTPTDSSQSLKDGHSRKLGHLALHVLDRFSSDEKRTIEISDDIAESDETAVDSSPGEEEPIGDAETYADRLQEICRVSDADKPSFDHFKRGEIAHMRCSPNGKWVAICHRHACIVYDIKLDIQASEKAVKKHFVLLADDDKRSAEHVEWAEKSASLLTRTHKELRLWKVTGDAPDRKSVQYDKRYVLREGFCKYMKWFSEREFIVLSDNGVLYRVDYEHGSKEATLLKEPESEGFHVTQVYPIEAEKLDWIICMGTRSAKLPQDVLGNFKFEGDGVDYILVLQNHSNGVPSAEPYSYAERFRRRLNKSVHASADLRDAYQIRHKKSLPRNIRNLKFCKHHQYMLVNYEENELGTTAPELWALNFKDPNSWSFEKVKSAILPVPSRIDQKKDVSLTPWGEASFAGPTHDIVVCEVDSVITFFKFDRSRGPGTLKFQDALAGERAPDFGDFFHPIFTWGDAVSYPLMVATDLDGKGAISVWSASNQKVESTVDIGGFHGTAFP